MEIMSFHGSGLVVFLVQPLTSITRQQGIGFGWSPTSRFVTSQRRSLMRFPRLEDGVDQRPGGFHFVGAGEERGVAL